MEESKKNSKSAAIDSVERKRRGRPKKNIDSSTEIKGKKAVKKDKPAKDKITKPSKTVKSTEKTAVEEKDAYDEEQIVKINFKGAKPAAADDVVLVQALEAAPVQSEVKKIEVVAAKTIAPNSQLPMDNGAVAATAANDDAVFEEKMNKADAVRKIIFDEIVKVDSSKSQSTVPVVSSVQNVANSPVVNVIKTDGNASGAIKNEQSNGAQAVIDEIKHKRSTRLYKKIAVFFAVAVFFVLSALYWFTFFEAKIVIVPRQDKETKNMIIDIIDSGVASSSDAVLAGVVKKIKVSQSVAIEATGIEIMGKEAIGKVKIVNNYIKDQPLVATTRMLSADGKLFRLKEAVTVPAGGEVTASIYADEPTAESAIGPTRFTIPGLWSGLQDKVYGESAEAVEYRQIAKKRVQQIDIDNGKQKAAEAILEAAKIKAKELFGSYSQLLVEVDKTSIASVADKQIGEEIEKFNIAVNADATVVGFDNGQAFKRVNEKFLQSLESGKGLEAISQSSVIYSLGTFNTSSAEASINVNVEGQVSIKDGSDLVARIRKEIIGLDKKQIEAYLNARKEIQSFDIVFKPAYRKSIPKYIEPSKIKVEIAK